MIISTEGFQNYYWLKMAITTLNCLLPSMMFSLGLGRWNLSN